MAKKQTPPTQTPPADEIAQPVVTTDAEVLIAKNADLEEQVRSLSELIAGSQQTPPYLVVIPYKAAEAQGDELGLVIAGWKKHFKENFKIVVVGDPATCLDSTILYVPHECTTDNPPLDIVSKMQSVIATFPEPEGLIWTNDDIYPVNDFTLAEVQFLKCNGLLTDENNTGSLYAYNRSRTIEALQKKGLPAYNYSCHLPVYYRVSELLNVIADYGCTTEAHLITSLYFNTVYPKHIPFKLNLLTDNLKCGVYRENPSIETIRQAFKSKIWINNSTAGWIPELQEMLEKHMQG